MLLGLLLLVVTIASGRCGSVTTSPEVIEYQGKLTLTSSYCDELGDSASNFNASHKKIKVVNPDALANCTSAKIIYLSYNEIETLDSNTFKSNEKAVELYLFGNKINYLPNDLFLPLKNLIYLQISKNPIGSTEPVLQGRLFQLQKLVIVQIGLFKLEAVDILQNLPNLKSIWLNHNFLECGTYNRIKAELVKHKVEAPEATTYPDLVGSKCLDMTEWTYRYLMHIYKNHLLETRSGKMCDSEQVEQKQKELQDELAQVRNEIAELKTNFGKLSQNQLPSNQGPLELKVKIGDLERDSEDVREYQRSLQRAQFGERKLKFQDVLQILITTNILE